MQASDARSIGKNGKNDLQKFSRIAEILGLLAENHHHREWVLKQVKKQHIKIPVKETMNSYEILKQCPLKFIMELHKALKGDTLKGLGHVESLTKTYHWLFTDIVGGSNPTTPTKDQIHKIVVLNELLARTQTFKNKDPLSAVILPVGDGVAVGFADSPEKPLQLAIELHKALFRYNQSKSGKEKLLIRIGIDMGPVYFVKDLNGKDNVWGPGIILTRRVMDLCGEMNIFTSARIADDLRKLSPEYETILHPIGNYSIKHGEELKIYNIYGDGFGNKNAPRKAKVLAPNLQRDMRTENNFSYNDLKIGLEILDPSTMLTRHTWTMNVVNVSKKPMTQVFYSLDGDVPKEFSDMNVVVKDDNDNQLEILSVNVNKPYHKEFNVQLNRPINPKQKRVIILRYDWDEPERNYFYRFASGCKHFDYSLTSSSSFQLEPKIYKIDIATGSKIESTTQPLMKIEKSKTIITWGKNDLTSDDAYQFTW